MSMVLGWLNSAGYFPKRFTMKRRLQQEEWHLEGEAYALRNDWTVFNEHVFRWETPLIVWCIYKTNI